MRLRNVDDGDDGKLTDSSNLRVVKRTGRGLQDKVKFNNGDHQ